MGAPARDATIRELVAGCRACGLWERATNAVAGEGPVPAALMLVGEQPGDHEDLAGRPFVGAAGRVLDEAMSEAGIDRGSVYLTNAVKHFKWKARGKRRIHDAPNRTEVAACRPWLTAELDLVQPDVVVVLGATAAKALLGSSFRLTEQRGCDLVGTGFAPHMVATAHPAAILRMPQRQAREHARSLLVQDLGLAARLAG